MKMIAFYNNKGGVGKTTTVINIAYALAKRNLKVLVIDCDGQCNTSRFFADDFRNDNGIEMAFLKSNISVQCSIHKTRYTNISVITASSKMNDILFEYEQLGNDRLRNIEKIKNEWTHTWIAADYDYIIVDLPPAMNTLTADILSVCDYVFIPIELGTFAVQGITKVTEKIANAGTKFGGCFASKYDSKNSADVELLDMLRKNLGDKVLRTTVPFSRAIKNSISYRRTVGEYMPWINPTRCYDKLADEVTAICNE